MLGVCAQELSTLIKYQKGFALLQEGSVWRMVMYHLANLREPSRALMAGNVVKLMIEHFENICEHEVKILPTLKTVERKLGVDDTEQKIGGTVKDIIRKIESKMAATERNAM